MTISCRFWGQGLKTVQDFFRIELVMNLRLPLTGLLGIGATLNGYPKNAPKPVDHTNQASSKPNVLIIYTDDMGVGDVSFLNNGWVQTPTSTCWHAKGW